MGDNLLPVHPVGVQSKMRSVQLLVAAMSAFSVADFPEPGGPSIALAACASPCCVKSAKTRSTTACCSGTSGTGFVSWCQTPGDQLRELYGTPLEF